MYRYVYTALNLENIFKPCFLLLKECHQIEHMPRVSNWAVVVHALALEGRASCVEHKPYWYKNKDVRATANKLPAWAEQPCGLIDFLLQLFFQLKVSAATNALFEFQCFFLTSYYIQ